jgi:tRNA(adenine34) deaminase
MVTPLTQMPPNQWGTWMQHALAEAQKALPMDVPVGCVIVHNGQCIAQAHNQREVNHNPAGHAEVLALQQAAHVLGRWRLTGCTVVVTLEPCPMCASLLQQARVDQVVFGAPDALWGACGSRYALWTGRTLGGIHQAECQHMLTQFFNVARQQPGE